MNIFLIFCVHLIWSPCILLKTHVIGLRGHTVFVCEVKCVKYDYLISFTWTVWISQWKNRIVSYFKVNFWFVTKLKISKVYFKLLEFLWYRCLSALAFLMQLLSWNIFVIVYCYVSVCVFEIGMLLRRSISF